MNDRHGGVTTSTFSHQEQRERFSDNHAAAENNNVSSRDFDSAFAEQTLTAKWRAGDESTLIAKRELGNIDRVEAINVFRRIEGTHDGRFINLFRGWRLDEDSVNRRIAI